MASIADLPAELLSSIASHVYAAGLPPASVSLDPFLINEDVYPPALHQVLSSPAASSGSWTEPCARKTLGSLCLVNRVFAEAAKPWLWRGVQVRLPRSWLALLDQLIEEATDSEDDAAAATTQLARAVLDGACAELRGGTIPWDDTPDVSVPPELLSPAASRDPSPRRLRSKSKSPPRWKIIRSLSDAMENLLETDYPFPYSASDPTIRRWFAS